MTIDALANHLWQSTVFVLAIAVLAMALRRNRARVRYWLWFSASVKFCLPFALLVSLGSHLPGTPAAPPPPPAALSWSVAPFSQLVVAEPLPIVSPVPSAARSTAPAPGIPMPAAALITLWAAGFLIVVLIRFRLWRQLRAAVRSSTPWHVPGLTRPPDVDVRAVPGLLAPGVAGVWRPVLLVPAGIERQLSPAQLDAVLAHEGCHLRQRDHLTASLHMVVEAVFWFHPLVWWIGARLVQEREQACDEEVLRTGSSPRAYAEAILHICRRYVQVPLANVTGIGGSHVRSRIEAIMDNRMGAPLSVAGKIALATASVMLVALPLMSGAMHAAQDDRRPGAAVERPQDAASLPEAPLFEVASDRQSQPAGAGLVRSALMQPNGTGATALAAQAPRSDGHASGLLLAGVSPPHALGATQDATTGAPIRFEVASVKRNASGPPPQESGGAGGTSMGVRPGTSTFTAINVPLRDIIRYAYSLEPFQRVEEGPRWMDDRYDIVAKLPEPVPAPEAARRMLQTLLAERFQLSVRWVMREQPVQALVLARRDGRPGSGLVRSTTDCEAWHEERRAWLTRTGGGRDGSAEERERYVMMPACDMIQQPFAARIYGGAVTMSELARFLSRLPAIGSPVLDRTGLTGEYDVEVRYAPASRALPGGDSTSIEPSMPSLAVALEEQLGLRLERTRGAVDMLVIDRVERPSED